MFKVRPVGEDADPRMAGCITYRTQVIAIDIERPPETQGESFFHELIHGILGDGSYFDEHDNEQLVQHLGAGMYQILKDLKWLPE